MKHRRPKTQLKSRMQRLQQAAQQSKVNEEDLKEECFHRNWNMELDSQCPQCGITAREILLNKPVYPTDRKE